MSDLPHPIPRRDIRFNIAEQASRDWYDGSPVRSAFADALSTLFPVGERFFIRSLTRYLPDLKHDKALHEDIRSFQMQEGMHTREHESYNATLRQFGYPVDRMEDRARRNLGRIKAKRTALYVTVAIEHLTATLAYMMFSHPRLLASVPQAYRDLWTWHCLEECEHRGVAYDVLREVKGRIPGWKRYLWRCSFLLAVTLLLQYVTVCNMWDIFRTRGLRPSFRDMARVFRELFIFPGYFYSLLSHYVRFFSPRFDPWKSDRLEALAEPWKRHFDEPAGGGQSA